MVLARKKCLDVGGQPGSGHGEEVRTTGELMLEFLSSFDRLGREPGPAIPNAGCAAAELQIPSGYVVPGLGMRANSRIAAARLYFSC